MMTFIDMFFHTSLYHIVSPHRGRGIIPEEIKKNHKIEGSKVLILGITFKENCPDIRNSRVIDVIRELQEFGCDVDVSDYWADDKEVQRDYNLTLNDNINYDSYSAIVLAVAHDKYRNMTLGKSDTQIVFDIKSILNHSSGRL